MNEVDPGALAASIRDNHLRLDKRIAKVRELESSSSEERFAVLVNLATDRVLRSEVAAEVGRAVARVVVAADMVDEVPLPDFNGSAYLGYDEQVTASQQPPT